MQSALLNFFPAHMLDFKDLYCFSDIHPHMFRHTFVSLLMSNPDIGVATVAAEAGHAQPSTTLMIYTQQYKKRRESIRNQLSRELYEK